ncbi:MAG: Smr/MutS family protein, partial [Acidobacteriota bacterium]
SLVILDEVGTGTDPAEGGALGTALVEHFRSRGALVLVSTHHGMLKAYATTTPGVGSASFEFDPVTYEPTYRLAEGTTGRSLAFEMALRLGLPKEVVQRAREVQGQKEVQVEELLEQLEAGRQTLAREWEVVEKQKQALEDARCRREAAEKSRREEAWQAFREELREEMRRARDELREILDEARTATSPALPPTRAGGMLAKVEKDADNRLDALETTTVPASEQQPAETLVEVHNGERVTISSLGLTGVVVETMGNDVEVVVRDKKLRIPLSELSAAQPSAGRRPSDAGRGFGRTGLPEPKAVPSELNVIGCTVDEALSQADKFLDDAFLSEHRQVRLIHGHGKGRLKRAIRQWLATHPHVAGHQSEGSGAVTVVELKS